MPKKCLYISSYHDHLERQELVLLNELGIEFFSTGKLLDPISPRFNQFGSAMVKGLDIKIDERLKNEFNKLNKGLKIWQTPKLTQSFVDKFDFVIMGHCSPNQNYLRGVWHFIKNKPVIFRTYGLQTPNQEAFMQDCKNENHRFFNMRFSDKEKCLPNYAGTDIAIPPYVDENEYNEWAGNKKQIYTAQNWVSSRRNIEREAYALHDRIRNKFPTMLSGISAPLGVLPPDKQLELFRESRVYFGLGSKPSPYTINIIEALMVGIPVITWNYKLGQDPMKPMYEFPTTITNWQNGLCSDDENEITDFINQCMNDFDFAKKIGDAGRKLALEKFSKAAVKLSWNQFLTDKGIL